MPSKESIVRRLNFCQWVDADNPWMSSDVWMGCEEDFDLQELQGGRMLWRPGPFRNSRPYVSGALFP